MPIKSFYRFSNQNEALLENAAKAPRELYQQHLSLFLTFSGLLHQSDEFFAQDLAALAEHSSVSASEDTKDDSPTVFIVNRDELMAKYVDTWCRFEEAARPFHQANRNVMGTTEFNRLITLANET
jgi:hypothetical protein